MTGLLRLHTHKSRPDNEDFGKIGESEYVNVDYLEQPFSVTPFYRKQRQTKVL